MKQYTVYFYDKSIEEIEAYGYNKVGDTVTFDMGRGRTRVFRGVKMVEEA